MARVTGTLQARSPLLAEGARSAGTIPFVVYQIINDCLLDSIPDRPIRTGIWARVAGRHNSSLSPAKAGSGLIKLASPGLRLRLRPGLSCFVPQSGTGAEASPAFRPAPTNAVSGPCPRGREHGWGHEALRTYIINRFGLNAPSRAAEEVGKADPLAG